MNANEYFNDQDIKDLYRLLKGKPIDATAPFLAIAVAQVLIDDAADGKGVAVNVTRFCQYLRKTTADVLVDMLAESDKRPWH